MPTSDKVDPPKNNQPITSEKKLADPHPLTAQACKALGEKAAVFLSYIDDEVKVLAYPKDHNKTEVIAYSRDGRKRLLTKII